MLTCKRRQDRQGTIYAVVNDERGEKKWVSIPVTTNLHQTREGWRERNITATMLDCIMFFMWIAAAFINVGKFSKSPPQNRYYTIQDSKANLAFAMDATSNLYRLDKV